MVAIDPYILEKAPGPVVEIPESLARARGAFGAALDALARLPAERLTAAWTWRGNPADVRYGFYSILEIIELATSAVERALESQPSSEARDAVGAATASRWALQGVLATLRDEDLDADPGGGEWTVRRTMQHIINSQRGYAWGSANWLSRRDQPRPEGPQRLPRGDEDDHFPEEEDEGHGSLADVRRQFDDVVDMASMRFATLTEDDMLVNSGWSGYPVTIGFRQWRWSSHIAEHTVQVEKTIDLLGRRRSEVDWLTRLNARAFGRLGSVVFGRASAGAAGPMLDQLARDLNEQYLSVVAAAEANVPAEDW